MNALSTLTHRYAAIQIKMWHIQFRMRQIYLNQHHINTNVPSDDRERIKALAPAMYSVVDMLVTMEHLEGILGDILQTRELSEHLSRQERKALKQKRDLASRWKAVRNVFGGHIDISIVEDTCARHGIFGTLLSNDLEADLAVYNCLVLEGAINRARQKSDLFGRDLNFKKNLPGELKIVTEKLNNDWNELFSYFAPLMERIYEIGKEEKLAVTPSMDHVGLVKFD